MQSGPDVTSGWHCGSHCFDVRPVVIADYGTRTVPCPTQSSAEEGDGTGAVPFVPQQNVDDLSVLIDGAIQVAFLSAAEAKDFIHVPPPSHSPPVALKGLGQLR
jgi:hypothetical protein